MKKGLSIILTSLAILIFMVSIAVMLIGTQAMRRNEPLFIFGYSFSIIPSESMIGDLEDSLDKGDIAIIRKAAYDEVAIGDVIVFQSEVEGSSKLVIHRVVGEHHEGGFETKGDHNASVDLEPVTEENFQAIYVSKITFLKPLALFAAFQKNIIFGILSLVLVAMIVTETIHIIKTVKKTNEEKMKVEKEAALKEQLYQEVLAEEQKKKEQNTSSSP